MVVVQASKLTLPQTSSSSSSLISSILFDPHSLSLALNHSDSSFSLYPSLSPPLLSLPPPQTLIPPPSSSATFLRLQNPNSPPRLLFLVSSPLHSGSALLLRFWILNSAQSFVKTRIICNQKSLRFDDKKSGVVFGVNHGVSIKLSGSINVFVMYSVSNCKIWVFAAKMVDVEDTVKLMKCAEIDCCVPVFSITVSFGFLLLGEENGVRVFPLRMLVKGRDKRQRRESRNLSTHDKLNSSNGGLENSLNSNSDGKIDKHCDSVKKPVKLRQDSEVGGACFVAFKNQDVESYKTIKVPSQSAKAISIQALSPTKFLILCSTGEIQLLCLSNSVIESEIPCHVKQLTDTMKVDKLVVLPDNSTGTQTIWISDGCYSVHTLAIPDMDTVVSESDRKDSEGIQTSVIQAIFTSEKIQDVIPLGTNAILILGQGSLFAYTIS